MEERDRIGEIVGDRIEFEFGTTMAARNLPAAMGYLRSGYVCVGHQMWVDDGIYVKVNGMSYLRDYFYSEMADLIRIADV